MGARLASGFALAFVLAVALATPARSSTQFLRRPDIHGDQVVFTSEGDLWLGSITAGTATRITSDEGVEGPAYFSPDGTRLAFTAQYDGGYDVYVMDVAGGMPMRLTWDPTGATTLGWSPDGTQVLFRSRRGQGIRRDRLWAVPAGGGAAQLLPIPYGEFAAVNADGHRIAYVPVSAEWQHWKRYRGGQADDVWLADTTAHTFRRLTDNPVIDTEPHWLGDRIVFLSERDGHANLWLMDAAGGGLSQATHYTDYGVRYPGTDGRRVVYEHGDGLGLYDPAAGTSRELSFELHSDRIHERPRFVPALDHLFDVALGPTGQRLLVSARGQILSAPVEHGDVRVAAAQDSSRCHHPAWSPDGTRLAFVSDASGEEEVWLAPAAGGAPTQLTRNADHRGPLGPLVWSPDGRWIATSDHEMRILLVDEKSGAIRVVDQSDRGGSYDVINDSYRFSPDGRWLAFGRIEPNWNWTVHLYDIAGAKETPISSAEMNSYAPAFDPDGRYLYFLSDRAFDPQFVNANRFFTYDKFTKVSLVTLAADTLSPFLPENQEEAPAEAKEAKKEAKPAKKSATSKESALPDVHVDLAGIADRIVDVPVPADRYQRVETVEGRLLLETLEGPQDHGDFEPVYQLRAFDMKKRKVDVLVDRLSDFQVSADGKKLLIQKDKDFSVVDASADDVDLDKGAVNTDDWTLKTDPAGEWWQIFQETWRIARDFFYDPGMHGVDWNAVRTKYEAELPAVADRSDLTLIQGQMVAELNCGHAYILGGDRPHVPEVPMGFLGADFEPVKGAVPAYRVTKVYPGDGFDLAVRSPLLEPGVDVKAGDYILAVAGQPVRADQDLQALLAGTAGRVIRLTVNDRPSLTGAREVHVKPLESERMLRYYDWVASRVAYVHTHGGPDIGYVHLPNMVSAGLREFGKHYYPSLTEHAMVYDVRYNTGGYIDAMLLLQLSSKPYSYFKPRYGASWTRQDWAFAGPAAALCNDQSYSDAEEFSDAFQRLKVGPVFGVPTWGGEVGSGGGYPLLDGGEVYIPNYGEWVPGAGWVIEGTGVQPDIVVEENPTALMAGRDPQLDRAIAYLKEELAKHPVKTPEPPPFPKKAPAGP